MIDLNKNIFDYYYLFRQNNAYKRGILGELKEEIKNKYMVDVKEAVQIDKEEMEIENAVEYTAKND